MIHALDKDTGETLWETELDANPDGIPAVYEVAAANTSRFTERWVALRKAIAYKPGKPGAQGYYVFALPETDSKTH